MILLIFVRPRFQSTAWAFNPGLANHTVLHSSSSSDWFKVWAWDPRRANQSSSLALTGRCWDTVVCLCSRAAELRQWKLWDTGSHLPCLHRGSPSEMGSSKGNTHKRKELRDGGVGDGGEGETRAYNFEFWRGWQPSVSSYPDFPRSGSPESRFSLKVVWADLLSLYLKNSWLGCPSFPSFHSFLPRPLSDKALVLKWDCQTPTLQDLLLFFSWFRSFPPLANFPSFLCWDHQLCPYFLISS